jgi:hypothetical protein
VLDAVYSQIGGMIDTMVMRIVMIFAVIHQHILDAQIHVSRHYIRRLKSVHPPSRHISNPIPMTNETDIQQAL